MSKEFENDVNARINDLYSITGKELIRIKADIDEIKKEIEILKKENRRLKNFLYETNFWV